MASSSNICLKSVGTTDFNLVMLKTFSSPFGRYLTCHTLTSVGQKSFQYAKTMFLLFRAIIYVCTNCKILCEYKKVSHLRGNEKKTFICSHLLIVFCKINKSLGQELSKHCSRATKCQQI